MFGVGIEVEMVPKSFDREDWALDERIGFREIIVIPDHFPGQRREMDNERAGEEDRGPAPVTPEEPSYLPNEIRSIFWLDRRFLRRLGHGDEVGLLAGRLVWQRRGADS
jgi:hypothetical protein